MAGFSEMDKSMKIKIGVAAVGLLVGAVLVINFFSDGAVVNIVAPPVKPEPPKLEAKQQEAYNRRKEEQKQREESGEVSGAGG